MYKWGFPNLIGSSFSRMYLRVVKVLEIERKRIHIRWNGNGHSRKKDYLK